jgi:hypothetical protein
MVTRNIDRFKTICTNIYSSIPDDYDWQWEDRFGVVMTVFDKIDMDEIRTSVLQGFDQHWDSSNVNDAPEIITSLIKALYGISPGQVLFHTDQETGIILYAAWWPWGNGVNISLRIGIYQPQEKIFKKEEIEKYLKEWFSL